MDEIAGVDELYTLQLRVRGLTPPKKEIQRGCRAVTLRWGWYREKAYQLVCDEEDGLEGEMLAAHLEEVLERGTKEVKDHDIEISMLS